jgi:Holliday junction resolvasome RuvABC DNA-binding subunit
MFHLYDGKIQHLGAKQYILNTVGGIEVDYKGSLQQGLFFVYPLLDERAKTVHYFAFESAVQKDLFSDLLKVQGVGPKTAFSLAHIDPDRLRQAIKKLDPTIFH